VRWYTATAPRILQQQLVFEGRPRVAVGESDLARPWTLQYSQGRLVDVVARNDRGRGPE